MTLQNKKPGNRYVNDLRRYAFGQSQFRNLRKIALPVGLSILFLALVGIFAASSQESFGEEWLIVIVAAVVGGYMALNIGANDVANNMGPAVGGSRSTMANELQALKLEACVLSESCHAPTATQHPGEDALSLHGS